MAGNDEGDRVGTDRRTHGAGGGGLADIAGDVRIGNRAAHRDFQEAFPHPHLKIRTEQHDAQRPVRRPHGRIKDARGVGRRRFAILEIFRIRPAAGHVLETGPFLARIGKGAASKATIGHHDQRKPEGRGVETVTDRQPAALGLPFAGRHGLMGDEQIVQAARPGHANLDRGFEQRQILFAQQPLGMIQRYGLQECLGRQAGPASEGLLQLRRRLAEPCGNGFEGGLLAIIQRQKLDNPAHRLVIGSDRGDVFVQHDVGVHCISPNASQKTTKARSSPPVSCVQHSSIWSSAIFHSWSD